MRHTIVILLLTCIGLLGCNAQPTNSFSKLYKNTDIHYSYHEASQTHDYSRNWDFDGDGIADELLFVGNGGAHLQFHPKIHLSSIDTTFFFPDLSLDMPTYETSYPPQVGFSTLDFYHIPDGRMHYMVMNVSSEKGIRQILLFYDDFLFEKGMKIINCPTLQFSDGHSALFLNKFRSYHNIDSISVSSHSFNALYLSCCKGDFNFQKQDLEFIKNEAVRKEIAYYYVIRDYETEMPPEPTAVFLLQGGEEFYITTVERVENSCGLPENTPVTCKAYLFEVYTKEGVFNEMVIYDMTPKQN
ncbi:MAG: hypothetical protein IKU03_01785 [Bacteroidales bacterium]|nr:hypothetical protein [Bacteroidales bacterium]